MFNLINQLTNEDRTKIENYISLYGASDHFIGIDAWLESWAKNKIKLYKLLGNNLIYKVPYTYEMSDSELSRDLEHFYDKEHFPNDWYDWLDAMYDKCYIPRDQREAIGNILWIQTFVNNKIPNKIKFRLPSAKKELQLQAGTKPMKAISQLLSYAKQNSPFDNETDILFAKAEESFKSFQTNHSVLFTTRTVHGNMVLSIHPLDFMTMSDNNSTWQSCMSWKEQGCYHTGTIEMMNSNNVVCCYLEGRTSFDFRKETDENIDPNYLWNNKKWRQLLYVTKDIIVTGKPYPYVNDELSKALLLEAKKLAKRNLNWVYSFGIERYQDMKYINSMYSMDRAREWIKCGQTTKHNILFDTKGMYNDMLNDSHTRYWCVRNKVDHTKIISYSGKAPCLCCGQTILEFDDCAEDYNDRYSNVDSAVCYKCERKYFNCTICDYTNPMRKHYKYYKSEYDRVNDNYSLICENCFKEKVAECPCCGKPFFVESSKRVYMLTQPGTEFNTNELKFKSYYDWHYDPERFEQNFETIKPICVCQNCATKMGVSDFKEYRYKDDSYWIGTRAVHFRLAPYRPEGYEKYLKSNLKTLEPQDGLILTPYEDVYDY